MKLWHLYGIAVVLVVIAVFVGIEINSHVLLNGGLVADVILILLAPLLIRMDYRK